MITLVFGTVLPWLLIAVGAWLGFQLVRQSGRILLRLEAIERRLGATTPAQRREPAGLPVGTGAPDFELPDLEGARRKLSEFRGQDLLLVFFNPKCGFCTKVADDLAALPLEAGGGRAMPLVVTTGDPQENRQLVERHGIRCVVLLQEDGGSVASAHTGRRWATGSTPPDASPANWPSAANRCCNWRRRFPHRTRRARVATATHFTSGTVWPRRTASSPIPRWPGVG